MVRGRAVTESGARLRPVVCPRRDVLSAGLLSHQGSRT